MLLQPFMRLIIFIQQQPDFYVTKIQQISLFKLQQCPISTMAASLSLKAYNTVTMYKCVTSSD